MITKTIQEQPKTLLINTNIVLNALTLHKDVSNYIIDVYIACIFCNHGISIKSITKFFSKYLNKKIAKKTVEKHLNILHYFGYIKYYRDHNIYRLKNEKKVTRKLIYGEYGKKTWTDCYGKEISGLNYRKSITFNTIRKELEDGKYIIKTKADNIKSFTFFEQHENITKGFGNSTIKIFKNHTFSKFRKYKYNSLKTLLNEELVCKIWFNTSVTAWNIKRVLHITDSTINNFKCNKHQQKVTSYDNVYNGFKDKYIINGNVYTKDIFATRLKINSFIKKSIYFDDREIYNNNKIVTPIQKRNNFLLQRRIKIKRNIRNLRFQRRKTYNSFSRSFCSNEKDVIVNRNLFSDWKQKYLFSVLDDISFLSYVKYSKYNCATLGLKSPAY